MVKGEHYLPRFYLEKFSKNGKISALNISDGKIIHTNVEKIGKKSYFYDLDPKELKKILYEYKKFTNITSSQFDELTNDIQFVEKALSRLEDKAAVLFAKFENDFDLINDEEFLSTLFLFVHTLSVRTMSFHNSLENIAEQTTNWLKSLNIEKVENYPLDKRPQEIAKINQLYEITSLAQVYKKGITFFNNYDLYVGINETDIDFLISDNPLIYFMLGFNDICFPINPKLAIIMQVKTAKKEFKICNFDSIKNNIVNLNVKEVLKYNILQQNTDAKYLFGSDEMLQKHSKIMSILKIVNFKKNNIENKNTGSENNG
ncbi:MAG: DUF4238 domain-containing protein [Bacilli bacterium]|nr:DUF4238 domain-containing protein [Bacilli bacterium]